MNGKYSYVMVNMQNGIQARIKPDICFSEYFPCKRYFRQRVFISLFLFSLYLKADMNSAILLQTAAILFSYELLSETRYWLGVCHG